MSAHTPGPWETRRVTNNYGGHWVVYGGGEPLADVSHWSEAVDEADARLIAAAPDLLEALERFVSEYVEMVDSGDCGNWDPEEEGRVKAARAAIAKARESQP